MFGIYNRFSETCCLSESNEPEVVVDEEEEEEEVAPQEEFISESVEEMEARENTGLVIALENYKKLYESKELTDKEKQELEKKLKEIEKREVIETDPVHEPAEIPVEKGKIAIGPPTLTRFEKARILGARALQLSLGAPPFIPIPENARTSLDIAMEELERKVIPIVIRRTLPNNDYQNIPIDFFK